jgi:hypothetical protein
MRCVPDPEVWRRALELATPFAKPRTCYPVDQYRSRLPNEDNQCLDRGEIPPIRDVPRRFEY